jgi:hypothetical protein
MLGVFASPPVQVLYYQLSSITLVMPVNLLAVTLSCRVHHTVLSEPSILASINLRAVVQQAIHSMAEQGQAQAPETANSDVQVRSWPCCGSTQTVDRLLVNRDCYHRTAPCK